MPEYLAPGVYVKEVSFRRKPIEGAPTSTVGFVGASGRGPSAPRLVTSWGDYENDSGGILDPALSFLPFAIRGFFENGGRRLYVAEVESAKDAVALASGLLALEAIEEISVLSVPDEVHPSLAPHDRAKIMNATVDQCERRRDRIAILNMALGQVDVNTIHPPRHSGYAAVYYPWLRVSDAGGRRTVLVPPCGHVAGIYARTDIERGVHKAPANEVVRGAVGLEFELDKAQQDVLNPRGINCLRSFEDRGLVVWGARTVSSDAEWKYVNVRRYFIYLERSIEKGTQWAVLEPNGEPLWAAVRRAVEDFLYNEWKSGRLQGAKPEDAYFVCCDRSTMTQNDIDNGRLICEVGVAMVRPAEFVVFRIGQKTADAES